MQITASLVKELRDKTSAGMMDCKKALTECDGDMAKAIDWLREKGISKAAKKAGRIAAEGLSRVYTEGNKAVLVELNIETDFAAKNEKFITLIDDVAKALLAAAPKTMEEANAVKFGEGTIADAIVNATATIGEKVDFRRFEIVEKADDELFGMYMHNAGAISALAVVKTADAAVAKDMAMQVASMAPQFVSQDMMDQEFIEHEKKIQLELMKNDEKNAGKSDELLEKILGGKLSKVLQDYCLVDQVYFKDQDIKVAQFLKQNNASVTKFVRYAVGEGIEKKQENFEEEVNAIKF